MIARVVCFGVVLWSSAGLAQDARALFDLFGGMMQSAISQATLAEWRKVPAGESACIDQSLRAKGLSLQVLVQRGVQPSDAQISELRSACRTQPAQPAVLPRPASAVSYSVDRLALGGRVHFESAAYRDYQCEPSQQFEGFIWCQRSRVEQEPRGRFTSSYSILHSADGTVAYVNRSLTPAFFRGREAQDEVDRLSSKHGSPPRIISVPAGPGRPAGFIAVWGNVALAPLGEANVKELAAGRAIRAGLMIDHIGSFQRSAQLGLPIYQLQGGPGYVWAGSWDERGRGSLRFLAVDASTFMPPIVEAKAGGPVEESTDSGAPAGRREAARERQESKRSAPPQAYNDWVEQQRRTVQQHRDASRVNPPQSYHDWREQQRKMAQELGDAGRSGPSRSFGNSREQLRDTPEAERRQRSLDAQARSQASYDEMQRQQREAGEAEQRETELLKRLETELNALPHGADSRPAIEEFCSKIRTYELDVGSRARLRASCGQKLQVVEMREKEAAQKRAAEAATARTQLLVNELNAMPLDEQTLEKLQNLRAGDEYRNNTNYGTAVDSKMFEIRKTIRTKKCAPISARVPQPAELQGAIMLDGLEGMPLSEFLCSIVAAGAKVTVKARGESLCDIKVGDVVLTFAVGRYLRESGAFVGESSPIMGGVRALALQSVVNGRDEVPIGNPNFFVINFYSQFTPALNAFLKQN
jgi:hypothetical protein